MLSRCFHGSRTSVNVIMLSQCFHGSQTSESVVMSQFLHGSQTSENVIMSQFLHCSQTSEIDSPSSKLCTVYVDEFLHNYEYHGQIHDFLKVRFWFGKGQYNKDVGPFFEIRSIRAVCRLKKQVRTLRSIHWIRNDRDLERNRLAERCR